MRLEDKKHSIHLEFIFAALLFGWFFYISLNSLNNEIRSIPPEFSDLKLYQGELQSVKFVGDSDPSLELIIYNPEIHLKKFYLTSPFREWVNLVRSLKKKTVQIYAEDKFIWQLQMKNEIVVSREEIFENYLNSAAVNKQTSASMSWMYGSTFAAFVVAWIWFANKKRKGLTRAGRALVSRDRVEVYRAKSKQIVWLIMLAMVCVIMIRLVLLSAATAVIFGLPTLAFIVILISMLKTYFSKRPEFVLTKEHIEFYEKGVQRVPWSTVTDVEIRTMNARGEHFVFLEFDIATDHSSNDSKTFMARMVAKFRNTKRRFNLSLLDADTDELINILKQYVEFSTESYY